MSPSVNDKKSREVIEKQSVSDSVISGTSWTYASRYGGKIINLIATAVLARLLTQEDFGVAGYALVFIGFLEILEGFGVGPALIYSGSDERSRNTAFRISVIVGIALGILTYLVAPLAGVIFNDPRAVPVTQALAIVFPITALRTVHRSILQRDLKFSLIAIPEFSRAGVKAIAAVGFAIFALGPWSLIIAQIVSSAVEAALYWYVNKWRPARHFKFEFSAAKNLLSYGGGVAGLQVIGAILLNLDYLFIGRYIGAAALGTYMIGFRVPALLIRQFISTTSQVIFPVFVRMNENKESLAAGWLVAIRYILIITVPASLGLVAIAEPFVIGIFGEKWRDAIPVVIAISLYSLIVSIEFNSGDVYKAQGRVYLLIRLSLLQAAITVPALWAAAVYLNTIAAVAWTQMVVVSVMTTIRLTVASRVLEVPFSQILKAMSRPLICGVIMLFVVLWSNYLTVSLPEVARLFIGIGCGAITYSALSWFVQREDIRQAISAIRAFRAKRR